MENKTASVGLYLNDNYQSIPNGAITFGLNIELDPNTGKYYNSNSIVLETEVFYTDITMGYIEMSDGVILFSNTTGYEARIRVLKLINGKLVEEKSIRINNYNFTNTVTGTYSYNYRDELIIAFTEGLNSTIEPCIVNYTLSEGTRFYSISSFKLVNDFKNPLSKITYIDGQLPKGSYQFAIRFKISRDDYTTWSTLTPTYSVYGDDTSSFETPSNKGLYVRYEQLASVESTFTYEVCQIAIVHIDNDSNTVYITDDIESGLDGDIVAGTGFQLYLYDIYQYSTISLDELTIKPVSIIRAGQIQQFDNKLIVGGVKTYSISENDDAILESEAKKIKISVVTERSLDQKEDSPLYNEQLYININIKNVEHVFQDHEYYVFKLLVFDIKGNYLNRYDIGTYLMIQGDMLDPLEYGRYHRVFVDLDSMFDLTLDNQYQYAIGYCEHTDTNSRVLSNPICIRDGYEINDDGKYVNVFKDSRFRVYPVEKMYNKVQSFNARLIPINWIAPIYKYNVSSFDLVNRSRQKLRITTYNDSIKTDIIYPNLPNQTLNYVSAQDTSDRNFQGDDYYRYDLDLAVNTSPTDPESAGMYDDLIWTSGSKDSYRSSISGINTTSDRARYRHCVSIAINTNIDSTSNILESNNIVIATSVISTKSASIELKGDTYGCLLGMRSTAPLANCSVVQPEGDVQLEDTRNYNTVAITTIGYVFSKMNVNGLYKETTSPNIIVIKNDNYGNAPESIGVEDFTNNSDTLGKYAITSYVHTNGINNEENKAYNQSLSNKGLEVFPKLIDDIYVNIYPNRIYRSNTNSSESLSLGWKSFRANEYTDIDGSKGDIIHISKYINILYIQCQNALFSNSLKQTLDVTDDATTYLGTGDLFSTPTMEVAYSDNGYISCLDYTHAKMTPFGLVIVDLINKRIFLINNSQPKIISGSITENWFVNHLQSNADIKIWYNQYTSTIYISHIVDTSSLTINYSQSEPSNWTLGYNVLYNVWTSFYSYYADILFNIDKPYMIAYNDNNIYTIDNDQYGKYFDYEHQSAIKILFNTSNNPAILDTVSWDTIALSNGRYSKNSFNYIFAHSLYEYTPTLQIEHIDNNRPDWWLSGSKGDNIHGFWRFNNLLGTSSSGSSFVNNLNTSLGANTSLSIEPDPYFTIGSIKGDLIWIALRFDPSKGSDILLDASVKDYEIDNVIIPIDLPNGSYDIIISNNTIVKDSITNITSDYTFEPPLTIEVNKYQCPELEEYSILTADAIFTTGIVKGIRSDITLPISSYAIYDIHSDIQTLDSDFNIDVTFDSVEVAYETEPNIYTGGVFTGQCVSTLFNLRGDNLIESGILSSISTASINRITGRTMLSVDISDNPKAVINNAIVRSFLAQSYDIKESYLYGNLDIDIENSSIINNASIKNGEYRGSVIIPYITSANDLIDGSTLNGYSSTARYGTSSNLEPILYIDPIIEDNNYIDNTVGKENVNVLLGYELDTNLSKTLTLPFITRLRLEHYIPSPFNINSTYPLSTIDMDYNSTISNFTIDALYIDDLSIPTFISTDSYTLHHGVVNTKAVGSNTDTVVYVNAPSKELLYQLNITYMIDIKEQVMMSISPSIEHGDVGLFKNKEDISVDYTIEPYIRVEESDIALAVTNNSKYLTIIGKLVEGDITVTPDGRFKITNPMIDVSNSVKNPILIDSAVPYMSHGGYSDVYPIVPNLNKEFIVNSVDTSVFKNVTLSTDSISNTPIVSMSILERRFISVINNNIIDPVTDIDFKLHVPNVLICNKNITIIDSKLTNVTAYNISSINPDWLKINNWYITNPFIFNFKESSKPGYTFHITNGVEVDIQNMNMEVKQDISYLRAILNGIFEDDGSNIYINILDFNWIGNSKDDIHTNDIKSDIGFYNVNVFNLDGYKYSLPPVNINDIICGHGDLTVNRELSNVIIYNGLSIADSTERYVVSKAVHYYPSKISDIKGRLISFEDYSYNGDAQYITNVEIAPYDNIPLYTNSNFKDVYLYRSEPTESDILNKEHSCIIGSNGGIVTNFIADNNDYSLITPYDMISGRVENLSTNIDKYVLSGVITYYDTSRVIYNKDNNTVILEDCIINIKTISECKLSDGVIRPKKMNGFPITPIEIDNVNCNVKLFDSINSQTSIPLGTTEVSDATFTADGTATITVGTTRLNINSINANLIKDYR